MAGRRITFRKVAEDVDISVDLVETCVDKMNEINEGPELLKRVTL